MAKDYKYSLIKGSRKLTCPHCGRYKCFKPYIDNETGEILHEAVGRCDHEQSCQYHYTPHDYFLDYPEARDQEKDGRNRPRPIVQNKPPMMKEYQQTEFFPLTWAEAAVRRESIFSRWFMALPFPTETKQQVLAEYYAGGAANDVCIDHVNYGKPVVFWMIDEQQRVHDAKLIAYHLNGHRVQGWGNSMRAICKKTGKGPQLDETEKVLFGLHLLPKYPEKAVCIVESEKTALICACHYPKFVWLATGGCGNLQTSKLMPLLNRRVIVYPDSGECDKWKKRMAESGHKNYTVMDFIDEYEPNTDIADVLLNVAKRRPATPEQMWVAMKADNPALNDIEAAFGPLDVCPF